MLGEDVDRVRLAFDGEHRSVMILPAESEAESDDPGVWRVNRSNGTVSLTGLLGEMGWTPREPVTCPARRSADGGIVFEIPEPEEVASGTDDEGASAGDAGSVPGAGS